MINPEAQPATVTEELLAEIARRLVAELSPRAIYLFGSHACGTPHADSDIDILVVLGDELASTWEVGKRGYACLHGLGLPVELHYVTEGRFRRFSQVVGSLQREVQLKGRVLYAA